MEYCRDTLISQNITIMVIILCSICGGVALCNSNTSGHILIPANADWRYQAAIGPPVTRWHKPEFDDANWKIGKAGFGYGDDDDRTQLDDMQGKFDSLRIRHNFELESLDNIKNLFLYVRYDDAFIAYLNGKEVTRSGVSEHNGEQTIEQHEADEFEEFSIANPDQLLQKGLNVLAIEGFNRSIDSSDFSLHPVLATQTVNNPQLPPILTREEVLYDLKHLEQRLEEQSSYLLLNQFDYEKAFKQLKDNVDEHITPLQFARDLQKLIARIGDAHAEVKLRLDEEYERYLPFILADSSEGIVALKADRSDFIHEQFPIIQAIDGKPIQYWLDIASRYVAQASPQFIRRESLLEIRSIDRLRVEDGATRSSYVDITLQSLDGTRQIKRRLETSDKRMPSGKLPLGNSQILPGNIGYLRISSMRNSSLETVISDMASFQDSNGLIIDVRDNRGGYYEILQTLYGYFLAEDAPPYVSNIAAYRRSKEFDYDHLHYRPTYRLEYSGWTNPEKEAIKLAKDKFKPEWQLPMEKFSVWHYMLLGRLDSPHQYYYQKPVAVLSNASSYSATDGFLSAFSDLPDVVLIGQPSSGASGATQLLVLPKSGIEIVYSSMASFRPNGKLFDGFGIDVDIPVKASPGDFLGRSDTVIDKAKEWIMQSRERTQ